MSLTSSYLPLSLFPPLSTPVWWLNHAEEPHFSIRTLAWIFLIAVVCPRPFLGPFFCLHLNPPGNGLSTKLIPLIVTIHPPTEMLELKCWSDICCLNPNQFLSLLPLCFSLSRSLPHTLNSLQHGGEHGYNCPLRDDVCFEQSDRTEIALTFCPYLQLVAQTQTAEWSGESAHTHYYLTNSPLCQITHQNMNKTTCHTLS